MPGDKVTNQVQFTAGYTFKKGSAVRVAIGKRAFELFTNADTAWARNRKDDAALVRAMRSGAQMIVTGVSSRGTKTKDTYSLSGISAAHKAIGKAFMGRKLSQAGILVLSSRISYELIQKAARARLPIMISNSRPTVKRRTPLANCSHERPRSVSCSAMCR